MPETINVTVRQDDAGEYSASSHALISAAEAEQMKVFDLLKTKVNRDTRVFNKPDGGKYKIVLLAGKNEILQEMAEMKTVVQLWVEYKLAANFVLGMKFAPVVPQLHSFF